MKNLTHRDFEKIFMETIHNNLLNYSVNSQRWKGTDFFPMNISQTESHDLIGERHFYYREIMNRPLQKEVNVEQIIIPGPIEVYVISDVKDSSDRKTIVTLDGYRQVSIFIEKNEMQDYISDFKSTSFDGLPWTEKMREIHDRINQACVLLLQHIYKDAIEKMNVEKSIFIPFDNFVEIKGERGSSIFGNITIPFKGSSDFSFDFQLKLTTSSDNSNIESIPSCGLNSVIDSDHLFQFLNPEKWQLIISKRYGFASFENSQERKKCGCGKTKDSDGFCDGSHATKMTIEEQMFQEKIDKGYFNFNTEKPSDK